MTDTLILTNAQVVTRDSCFSGTVEIRSGEIRDIGEGRSGAPGAVDCDGDFLLPGLIDIHTDNLEGAMEPRAGVEWPALAGLLAHDRQVVAAGITTVLDALSIGFRASASKGRQRAIGFYGGPLQEAQDRGLLRAEHYLHLRCELNSPDVVKWCGTLIDSPLTRLGSLMDHTPGQRQWRDVDVWRRYIRGKRSVSDAELDEMLERNLQTQSEWVGPNRSALLAMFRERGVRVASHDDTTPEHIEEAAADGIHISEFPTTGEAARAAHAHGMRVVMGGPNVVLGKSHSGNASARELAHEGLMDLMSSDYAPMSMVNAVFSLAEHAGMTLPDAVATASAGPAAELGFDDRGALACELRADLIRVGRHDGISVVRNVWRAGRQVA
ncbi:MAG: alpha-D-ribose 1-methylphosphonate 5-triphosphate diphosphatase [Acetobacterales bacterium]